MRLLKGLREFGLASVLALAAGCGSGAPSADVAVKPCESLDAMGYEHGTSMIPRQRASRLERDLEWPVKSEAVRPERVEWTLAHGQWYVKDQANDLENNLAWRGRMLDRDLDRANDELPRDGGVLLKMLFGFPVEHVPRHAVRMFY